MLRQALAANGLTEADYDVREVDLVSANNVTSSYLAINPNGTVRSLTSSSLNKPVTESVDILYQMDALRAGYALVPTDPVTQKTTQAIIDLVHADAASTDVILLHARLEGERAAHPENPLHVSRPKAQENSWLNKLYTTDFGNTYLTFSGVSHEIYRTLMDKLERAPSSAVRHGRLRHQTGANLHIAPWLAYALAGAGMDPRTIQDFKPLEKVAQKSVPGFKVGPRTKWWDTITATKAFKKAYPTRH
ncbi:Maleylacetoacetate isomerase [Tolypocladium paradoxum]|uniref:Maleylacetoacetate isomerase n=1 Tax=Tolypocladium paradoxum TaxID=94208 RepID=A0A2S4L5P7_9HYPO|nr:Maleylacetoacetate isomerase [Tolypocladium paradoxum]